jgi:nucleotide-binding universal stress UspA family protein
MKRLLVCTDGSNYSTEACKYAAWLAMETGASIDALYVTDIRQFQVPAFADLSGSLGVQPYDGLIDQLRQVEKLKADYIKADTLKIFEEKDLGSRATFHYETGLLVDEIDALAKNADLILMGKRGENVNFATEHLGSMLERVLRSVSKPCLVTSRKFKSIDRVAVAYDGAKSSTKALEFIAQNELFKALDLHIISVAESQGEEDEAASRLKEAEKRLNANGVYPACQVLTGEVETAVSDYVTHSKIDLLVAGAYGHSRIRELLIGSTTTDLLRRCHVPVLCFR